MHKFGANGEHVEAFLQEVRATDLDGWRRFMQFAQPSAERRAASRAINDVPMSAAVRTTVYNAALGALRSLGLHGEDSVRGLTISTRVQGAAMGIAAAAGLTPAQRRALLQAFADTGFRSVPPVLEADLTPRTSPAEPKAPSTTARAALIYQHINRQADHGIADAIGQAVKAARRKPERAPESDGPTA